MTDINKLINQLAAQQKLLQDTEFIAPCVKGGKVRTCVDGMVYTFEAIPPDFEGWGFFQPDSYTRAELVEEASLPKIAEYLTRFKPLRLRLVYPLRGQSWLAYPVNESDMHQRFKVVKPVAVHLVTDAAAFEPIIARCDGGNWWYEEIDRRAQPQPTTELANSLKQEIAPDKLAFTGMTPEMVTAYDLAWQKTKLGRETRQQQQDQYRLKNALKQGGADLDTVRDRGEFWQIEWRTIDGELHSSAIAKDDLTVVSSGICLSGRDRDFDLQSLVGVMEKRDEE